jgi:membrane protease YdiL (CAAX protease family)
MMEGKAMTIHAVVFIVVTLVLTAVFGFVQQKAGWSFEKITFPQLAHAAAGAVMILIWGGLPERLNFHFDTTVATRSIMAIAAPFGMFALTFAVGRVFGMETKITTDVWTLLPVMIAGMALGAVGEEIGWRGVLQPLLEKRWSVAVASVMVGLVWGLWHVGHYKNGVIFMVGFLLFTVSASVVLAWLLRGIDHNLIIASLFHLAINVGFLVFFRNPSGGGFMLLNGVAWSIMATIIVVSPSSKLFP